MLYVSPATFQQGEKYADSSGIMLISGARCYKRFSETVGKMNFLGFDRESWECRLDSKHAQDARSLLNVTTKTDI